MGKDERDPLRQLRTEADEHLFRNIQFDARLKERVLRELSAQSAAVREEADAAPVKGGKRRLPFRRLPAAAYAAVLAGAVLVSLSTLQLLPGGPDSTETGTAELDASLPVEFPAVDTYAAEHPGGPGAVLNPELYTDADDMSGQPAPSPAGQPACGSPHLAQPEALMPPDAAADSQAGIGLQAEDLPDIEAAQRWFGDDLLAADDIPASFQLERIRGWKDTGGETAYVCFRYTAGEREFAVMQTRQQGAAELPPGESVDDEIFRGVFVHDAGSAGGMKTQLHGIRDGIRFVVSGSLSREEALNVARSLKSGDGFVDEEHGTDHEHGS